MVSEIRTLIAAARQERDAVGPAAGAAGSSPYNPYAASAPPPMEERKEGVVPPGCSSPQAPPSCEYRFSQGGAMRWKYQRIFGWISTVVVGASPDNRGWCCSRGPARTRVLFPADGMAVVLAMQRASFRYL